MQTFLPLPDFAATAAVLDPRRLGKQRVEALQVLRALTWPRYGWQHHPVVRMWRGYPEAVASYALTVCRAWTDLGHADTCAATVLTDLADATGTDTPRTQARLAETGDLPPWLGLPELHRSHRSALLRKDPEHYRRYFPADPDDLPYLWPLSDRE